MNKQLHNEYKNTGFILDKFCLDMYQDKYKFRFSFEEIMLESTINGDNFDYETIDFLKRDYLNSKLYKPGNILVIPYNHHEHGWSLIPWLILSIDNGTTLYSKYPLFNASFDENNNYSREWKNSSIRKFLNSDEFLNRFPEAIQKNIGFHDIQTTYTKTSDRFWLLSWQELGYIKKTVSPISDYSDRNIVYNSDIFKTTKDSTAYFSFGGQLLRSISNDDIDNICELYGYHISSCHVHQTSSCTPVFILN